MYLLKNTEFFTLRSAALLCALFASPVSMAQVIEGVGVEIPGLVESSTKGAMVEILIEASKRKNHQINLEIMPALRQEQSFKNSSVMLALPFLKSEIGPNKDIQGLKSVAIHYKEDYIINLKDSAVINSLSDLDGLYVGLIRGFPYADAITTNPKIEILFAETDIQSVEQLLKQRVDAIIMDLTSFQSISKQFTDKERNRLRASLKPITREPSFIIFKNSIAGKEYRNTINDALIEMKNDGTFASIYERYEIPTSAWTQ